MRHNPSPDSSGNPFFPPFSAGKKIVTDSGRKLQKIILFIAIFIAATSCYDAARDCKDFRTGKYLSTIIVDGKEMQTVSERGENAVIETFKGKTDTASIRWVNDCEYVLQQINPKSRAERQAISIRILTTTAKSYTFEYGLVGSDVRQKGTATLIE